MIIFAAIQQFQIFKRLLLKSHQYPGNQFLVSNGFVLQAVGHHIINILNKYNIRIQVVQVFNQSTVTTGTEQQLTVITERLVLHISCYCIGTRFLLRERNVKFHPVFLSISCYLFIHQPFKQFTMLGRNREMHVYFSGLSGCIQGSFHQMFFQWSAYTIGITMKFQQAFRQSTIVQSDSFQQVCYHRFIILFSNQCINILAGIVQTSGIQVIIKSETMNMVEKLLFKICFGSLIIRTQEFKQILKHATGCPGSRYKLHNCFFTLFICIPCFQIFFHFTLCRSHNSLIDRSGSVQFQEREAFFKASQLFNYLLL